MFERDYQNNGTGLNAEKLAINIDVATGNARHRIDDLHQGGNIVAGLAALGAAGAGVGAIFALEAPPVAGFLAVASLTLGGFAVAEFNASNKYPQEALQAAQEGQKAMASWPEINGKK
jgi:hypothetical protein